MKSGASVFDYWVRRDPSVVRSAQVGSHIELDERLEHVLRFHGPLPPKDLQRLKDLGGEVLVGETTVLLSVSNFVGRTELAGVSIEFVSSKIEADGVSQILAEVSELSSSLIFGWGMPVDFIGGGNHAHRAAIPYHQLQYLRHAILGARPGERLHDFLAAIERSPTRRFERERPLVAPSQTKRVDAKAVRSIFSHLDRLVPVAPHTPLARHALAQKLTFGHPPRPHFPAKIAAPRRTLLFDTLENRFARHVLVECLSLLYRFAEDKRIHAGLRAECLEMTAMLEPFKTSPFIAEASALTALMAPSQTLAKAEGYRELFTFWVGLMRHVSLPQAADETQRLLTGRDMARLYEYWVFAKVLETVCAVAGARPSSLEITRNDLGESLRLGIASAVTPEITVRFNPTFSRSASTTYSTTLRPDVTLQIGERLIAFDAKYKLERIEVDEHDADEDTARYKRADLYKMHTYRDAIQSLSAAFVVYPGTEFVFFERNGQKRGAPDQIEIVDGVGAVPLRPRDGKPAALLTRLIEALLKR